MTPNRTKYSGAKLRQIVNTQGRRYDWLAERMGVSPSFLSKLFSGDKRINDQHAHRAADALGIPVQWLQSDAEPEEGGPPCKPNDERPDFDAGRA